MTRTSATTLVYWFKNPVIYSGMTGACEFEKIWGRGFEPRDGRFSANFTSLPRVWVLAGLKRNVGVFNCRLDNDRGS